MKYALLIYVSPDDDGLSDAEREEVRGEYYAISQDEHVYGGDQLQPVDSATTVRVQDG